VLPPATQVAGFRAINSMNFIHSLYEISRVQLLIWIFLGLHLFPLNALSGGEEPLIVKLATESPLVPLYLLPIPHKTSNFDGKYLEELEKILAFDLAHNGATWLSKPTSENNALGNRGSFNQLGSITAWKEQNISYVVKPHTQGTFIKALMLDVQRQSLKETDSIPLTGDFGKDRRQIHRLADVIHKGLMGVDGIASTRLLYTLKIQHPFDSMKSVSEIWEADYDGGNPLQLTQEDSICVTPIYLPPKRGCIASRFLYVSYVLGQPKIYIASIKGGQKHRLTSVRGNQLMPAMSRQRDQVAFICDITGNPDLFLQPFSPEKGAIGKPQQIFSARSATQGSPTFSPDGTRLAFVSDKGGSPKIYVIQIPAPGASIKDIQATLISRFNRENTAPCWSPDGKKLAYCARNKGVRQIWVFDFETQKETQLTQGAGNKENPSWAPNSLHLVFNSSDPQSGELFIIDLNQMEATQITFGAGEKRFPHWEPRPFHDSQENLQSGNERPLIGP